MKYVLFIIAMFAFSTPAFAAEVSLVGIDLTDFQKEALETRLEQLAPGAKAEVSIKKVEFSTYGIKDTFVRVTILQEGNVITGLSFYSEGDEFGSTQNALEDAFL